MITKAMSVGIYVSDQDRALEFYRDKLGFEVHQDTPMGESGPPGHEEKRWIEVSPKGAETLVILYTPPGMEDRIGGLSNNMLGTGGIQATCQGIEAQGVEL